MPSCTGGLRTPTRPQSGEPAGLRAVAVMSDRAPSTSASGAQPPSPPDGGASRERGSPLWSASLRRRSGNDIDRRRVESPSPPPPPRLTQPTDRRIVTCPHNTAPRLAVTPAARRPEQASSHPLRPDTPLASRMPGSLQQVPTLIAEPGTRYRTLVERRTGAEALICGYLAASFQGGPACRRTVDRAGPDVPLRPTSTEPPLGHPRALRAGPD